MIETTLKQTMQRNLTLGAAWLLAATVLAGCPRDEIDLCSGDDPHPECPRCLGDNPDPECPTIDGGVTDMSTTDTSTDLGPDTSPADMPPDLTEPDLGPCGGCEAPLLCNELSGECVTCLDTVDCADGVCDTATGECVGCVTNADCPDAAASLCDATTNTCTSCAVNDDCSHVPDATVCLTDTCVQCTDTADGRDACNGNSCDPATNLCTNTATESVNVCEACVADSECMPDHRCVPVDFEGAFHGSYCLRIRGVAPCTDPYRTQLSAESLSGAAAEPYCGPPSDFTTCEAIVDHVTVPAVTCSMDSDCGAPGVADGLCRPINTVLTCTYSCTVSTQCPDVCNTGTNACSEDL